MSSSTQRGGNLGHRDESPGNLGLTGLEDSLSNLSLTYADRSPRLDLFMLLPSHPRCSGSLHGFRVTAEPVTLPESVCWASEEQLRWLQR